MTTSVGVMVLVAPMLLFFRGIRVLEMEPMRKAGVWSVLIFGVFASGTLSGLPFYLSKDMHGKPKKKKKKILFFLFSFFFVLDDHIERRLSFVYFFFFFLFSLFSGTCSFYQRPELAPVADGSDRACQSEICALAKTSYITEVCRLGDNIMETLIMCLIASGMSVFAAFIAQSGEFFCLLFSCLFFFLI